MIENHQSRADNIFRAALFLSALLHLAVIMYLKLPELVEPMRSKMALSVILAKPQAVVKSAGEPPLPIVTPVTQQLPKGPPHPLPLPKVLEKLEQAPFPEDVPEPISEPVTEGDESPQETPADPVDLSSEIVEAAKVQALLLVDERGIVQRIIWKTLPALTDETLQQMEQHLRTKMYLATGKSYTLYEIVEIPHE